MLSLPMSWNGPSAVLVVVILLIGAGTGFGLASSPPNSNESNGLTPTERASLFSRDTDPQEIVGERESENKAIQELANGTDITFKRPVATAATWSRHDFRDLMLGGTRVSTHPTNADLHDRRFLKDVFTALFKIQPSSRAHVTPHWMPLYVAPNGTVHALVDYRIRVPENDTAGDRRIYWSIDSHAIKTVRLTSGDTLLNSTEATHTPSLRFNGLNPGNRTLTVDAVVNVTMQKKIREKHFRDDDEECEEDEDNDNDEEDDDDDGEVDEGDECYYWTTHYEYPSEEITVNESVDVTVYEIDPEVRYARFPDGSVEVLVTADRPWTGFTVGAMNVTGVWRFYTARDTRWDTLIASSASEDRRRESVAIPVYVHAYPSQTGVQIRPIRGPELLDVVGAEPASPTPTIGDNISVDVVTHRYRRSDSILIRMPNRLFDPESIRVSGIVRGESVTPAESVIVERVVRRSNLTVEVLRSNESAATLRIRLQDNRTGRPIVLQEDQHPRGDPDRDGYITVAGRRVETNSSGVALVTVDQPGVYTARYHPESWVRVDPAYTGDAATVRWHTLTTIDGWVRLLIQVVWMSIPFAVAYYAGTRLLVLLDRRHP